MKIISRWRYVRATAKWMKAELFWRELSPSTNMTWTSMGTTNCASAKVAESTLRNFDKFADVLHTRYWHEPEANTGSSRMTGKPG
jgi:hypothetical protein